MATELSHIGPGMLVVHQDYHNLESFYYILLTICLLYDDPGKLKPTKMLSRCFDPFFAITQPSTLKVVTIQSDFSWTMLMVLYISPYFRPLIPLLEKICKELILPIKLQGGVLQANHNFTHDKFIDGVVTVLAELPDKYWIPRESHTGKVLVPPQSSSTSTAGLIPSTGSTTPSTVLPGNPLLWLPLIQILGTSSTSSSKCCLENKDKSGSQLPKQCSPVGETTHLLSMGVSGSGSVVLLSPAIGWTKVDIPSSPRQTIHHPPSAPL